MTNVGGPRKTRIRRLLVEACTQALESEGWVVSRASGVGNSRIRRITKGGEDKLVAIRTSQDRWFGFPRTRDDARWSTLPAVDAVAVASLDPDEPAYTLVHLLDANDVKRRLDRAYAARRAAGHSIPPGRGVWIALYENEVPDQPRLVGAGAGLATKPIARLPLVRGDTPMAMGIVQPVRPFSPAAAMRATTGDADDYEPLTIAEAKSRLARTLGVDPATIKITVEA